MPWNPDRNARVMEPLPLEITCQEALARLSREPKPLLLDCREPEETALVSVEGSHNIPMSELAERIGELHPHLLSEVLVLCHHGVRSGRTAAWLRGQGFAKVFSVAGGIDRWAVEIEPGMLRY